MADDFIRAEEIRVAQANLEADKGWQYVCRDCGWTPQYIGWRERCGYNRPYLAHARRRCGETGRPAMDRSVSNFHNQRRGEDVADADSARLSLRPTFGRRLAEEIVGLARLATERCSCPLPDADSEPTQRTSKSWCERHPWFAEPDLGRVAHGVSGRVDRLKQLGNSIVPQIAEIIGRAIMFASKD